MSQPTLYTLGALAFQVTPWSMNSVAAGRAADWAPKDIIGAMRPREFVGVGDEKIEFTGKLFPHTFPDRKNSRQLLDDMRRSGSPYHLMRGDGKNMGWYVIESVTEEESFLDRKGLGRVYDYTISLTRVPTPPPESYLQTL